MSVSGEPSRDSLNLRPLGNLEKFHAVRHQLRFYTSVALTATYRLSYNTANNDDNGRSLKDDVYRACAMVIQQHPMLSVDVDLKGSSEPHFVRLPKLDLEKCVVFQPRQSEFDDQEVVDLLQTHHNTFFESGVPLWKLCVLEGHQTITAAFIFHHVICDGTAAKVFHATFAQALDQVLQSLPQTDVSSIVVSPNSSLPPNLEEQIDLYVSYWYLIKELFKSKFLPPGPSLWTGGPVRSHPFVNRLKHLVVPALATDSLRKTCSANGATITAFLQIILARLLFKHVDSKYTQLNFQGSISPRRWISDPAIENVISDFVVDYIETYDRHSIEESESPWDAIRQAKASLDQNMTRKGKDRGVGLLKLVPNVADDFFIPQLDGPRSASFEISNLGAFKNASSDDSSSSKAVSIERMIFSQSPGISGAAIVVSTITGGDGCLVMGFSWLEGVVEESLMESLMASVSQEISNLTSPKA